MSKGIYVEILIKGPMDALWNKTQTPEEHVQWDLRFTDIQYLPRPDQSKPQRFLYQTRLGFGLSIRGEGETLGIRETEAVRSSSLTFWSEDWKSLIRRGSGYWKYVPQRDGTQFFTWYDYEPRFGVAGRLFKSVIFSPLMGWTTAWSFDRLRLWIEKGIPPAISFQKSLIHGIARISLAFIWLYQGLAPKLLFRSADEIKMLLDAGATQTMATTILPIVGWLEILFGLTLLAVWRARWLFPVNIALMVVALAMVAIHSPSYLVAAFNPVSLNLAVVAISVIGMVAGRDIPSASRCFRRPKA